MECVVLLPKSAGVAPEKLTFLLDETKAPIPVKGYDRPHIVPTPPHSPKGPSSYTMVVMPHRDMLHWRDTGV